MSRAELSPHVQFASYPMDLEVKGQTSPFSRLADDNNGPQQQRPVITNDTHRFERTDPREIAARANVPAPAPANVKRIAWVNGQGKLREHYELLDVRATTDLPETSQAARATMTRAGVKGALENFRAAGWRFALASEKLDDSARVFMSRDGRVSLFKGRMSVRIDSPKEMKRLRESLAEDGFELKDSPLSPRLRIYTIEATGDQDPMDLMDRLADHRFVDWIEPELIEPIGHRGHR